MFGIELSPNRTSELPGTSTSKCTELGGDSWKVSQRVIGHEWVWHSVYLPLLSYLFLMLYGEPISTRACYITLVFLSIPDTSSGGVGYKLRRVAMPGAPLGSHLR